jgi:hypothetical protein
MRIHSIVLIIGVLLFAACSTAQAPLETPDAVEGERGAVASGDADATPVSSTADADSASTPGSGAAEDAAEDADAVPKHDVTAEDVVDAEAPAPFAPKSLVIALDGLRPDALAQADTPRLDALIAGTWRSAYQGAYSPVAQNLKDAVTVSGPNHVAIMTGATGVQHGVLGNDDMAQGNYLAYPHYLSLLEAADPTWRTAYLFTWGTDVEIPSGADYVFDAEDADNVARVAAILAGTHDDDAGLNQTRWPQGSDVDALFLFLDDPDHVGHGEGFEPGVAAYLEEIASIDAQIGTLLDAIVARPTFGAERWQIVLTSDHGGYHTAHGGNSAVEHTIPFLVASPDVLQGRLPPVTRNVDVVPTVLTHMGVAVPSALTGTPRGDVVESAEAVPLAQDLVAYYRFDGDLTDSAGAQLDASIGASSDVAPTLVASGGKFGGYLSIEDPGGGSDGACYLTLGNPQPLEMTDGQPFSVTLWFRSHGPQGGDPVILGNKDWASGYNGGWLLLANEGGDNAFGANFASGGEARVDLEAIDYSDTGWWFLAVVYDPQGLALMFTGDADGIMRWMALETSALTALTSSYPIHIGQDGTGEYAHNLDGDLDDLAIWRRALSTEEVFALYQDGQGLPVSP